MSDEIARRAAMVKRADGLLRLLAEINLAINLVGREHVRLSVWSRVR